MRWMINILSIKVVYVKIHQSNNVFARLGHIWVINSTMKINFKSSKGSGKSQHMHSKNDEIEIMIGNNSNEIVNELFSSLLIRYQMVLETSMKGSDFVFDIIDGIYCKCHRKSLNHGKLYIDS